MNEALHSHNPSVKVCDADTMNAHAQQVNIFPVGYRTFFLFPKAVSLTHVDKHAGVAQQRLMAISD